MSWYVQALPLEVPSGKSVVLARVDHVNRQPESVYHEFKKQYPRADPERMIEAWGGKWQVVETLTGPPAPMTIVIPKPPPMFTESGTSGLRAPRPLRKGEIVLPFYGGGGPTCPTRIISKGEYWLVVYDPKIGRGSESPLEMPLRLTGPDDVLLTVYRRHLAAAAMRDENAAFARLKKTLMNSGESVPERLGALRSLWCLAERKGPERSENPLYGRVRSAMIDLLREPSLSLPLRRLAMQSVAVDGTRDPQTDAETAFVAQYLIDTLTHETEQGLVWLAAERLYYSNIQSGAVNGKPVAIYFPRITEALEAKAREKSGASGGAQAAQWALNNLKLAGRRTLADVKKSMPVVVRTIPLYSSVGDR